MGIRTEIGGMWVRNRMEVLLVLARQVAALVGRDRSWQAWAYAVIVEGWNWVRGDSIAPRVFEDYFHDEHDRGIDVFAQKSSGVEQAAWIVLGNIVLYLAWHVYREVGDSQMSETVCEVSEEILNEVFEQAKKLPIDWSAIGKAIERINGARRKEDEEGDPIFVSYCMTYVYVFWKQAEPASWEVAELRRVDRHLKNLSDAEANALLKDEDRWRLGPFGSDDEAEAVADQLRAAGLTLEVKCQ